MSNACDPRNRPGFIRGDLAPFLPDEMGGPVRAADDLRTVVWAGFVTALIVAAVFAVVLLTQ